MDTDRIPQHSAQSALPLDKILENAVESAGIFVKNDRPETSTRPFQEIAAKRSREQMAEVSNDGVSGEDGHTGSLKNVENIDSKMKQMRFHPSKNDPLGSWTGIPENPYDVPVQDVDDL